jgi:hypothetical protein
MTSSLVTRSTARLASPVAGALVADWERLRFSDLHIQRVRNWGVEGLAGPFGDLEEVLEALGRFGEQADDCADQRLSQVVALAATDEFAATIVLHRLLPALVSVARRRGGEGLGHQQRAMGELLPHAWIAIRTFRIDVRCSRVAAGLIRDIEYQTFVRNRRLRSALETAVDTTVVEPASVGLDGRSAGAEHPMDTVVAMIGEARSRGVNENDLRFALAWAAGADSKALAAKFGISDRMVRYRRNEVASRLRQALGADAA